MTYIRISLYIKTGINPTDKNYNLKLFSYLDNTGWSRKEYGLSGINDTNQIISESVLSCHFTLLNELPITEFTDTIISTLVKPAIKYK